MVRTGVLLGICKVELMFTIISALSAKGGQAKVGNSEFAPTNPESALDLPAIVT